MIIENKRTISRQKFRRFILAICFAVIESIIFGTEIFNFSSWPDSKVYIGVFAFLPFFFFFTYEYYINYHYIFFSDKDEKIIFRYFSTRPLNTKSFSIQIPKKSLYKFSIKKTFFNKKIKLILYQKTSKGIAKYPELNISALKQEQIINLQKTLEKYCIAK